MTSPTGTVLISGTAREDEVLTASHTLADQDGLGVISWQWNRDSVMVIDEATEFNLHARAGRCRRCHDGNR